jgi:hypothetical protein
MNIETSEVHPATVVDRFVRSLPFGTSVELGSYRYLPKTVSDERVVFRISASRVLPEFRRRGQTLDAGQEIAFHSRVRIGFRGKLRHIPMIDFKASRIDVCDLSGLTSLRKEFGINQAVFYASGRSYHMYGLTLLTHEEWLRFMYRLLLLNDDQMECVDARWVAHRLLAGYSALRWTLNSAYYQSIPTLVHSPAFA